MSNILSRVSLRYQIGLIGLIGVLGLGLFGLIYFVSSTSQQHVQQIADNAAAEDALLKNLDIGLLQARRAEKDFLLRLDDKYTARHKEQVDKALALIVTLQGRLTTAEEIATLGRLESGVQAYGAQFIKMADGRRALGLTEKLGLMVEMRDAVHAIEASLKNVAEKDLAIGILTMRRYEKDFFSRLDPKNIESFKAAVTSFSQLLNTPALSLTDREAITGQLQIYEAKFLAASDQALAVINETKKLSESYSAFEPDLAAIDERITGTHAQASKDIEEIRAATSARLAWSMGLVTLAVIAVATVVAMLISRPLINMTHAMTSLAGGDKTTAIAGTMRRDEIGSMAKAVQVFKDNAIEMDRLQAEQKETERLALIEKRKTMNALADGFESSVGNIVTLVVSAATEMRSTAEGMSQTADRTSEQATIVAAASTQASANVQMVAAATEELSSSVGEIGRQVNRSSQIASQAVDEATKTNASINGLASAAQLIGKVVQLINDIAGQTNLLALNATIEAARAGDAGRGFAVVASEVKNLAMQTGRATEEIAGQVTHMQSATNEAVDAIKAIGDTIGQISEITTAISAAVEEQGAATQEIASNVQQAAVGTDQVSRNISSVTEAAGETGLAAKNVLTASHELAQQGERLRGEVNGFLQVIRAG